MGVVAVTDHVFSDLDTERRLLGDAGHELRYDGDLAPDELGDVLRDVDAVLNCYLPIPAEVVEGLDRCRVIARYGIGLDTIPIGTATAKGILVTNVPDYCIDEVSDHALALILAVARSVVRHNASVRGGSWSALGGGPIHRLRGRRLGLVGFGRIARALAVKASGLGFGILATDPYLSDVDVRAAGAEPRSLDDLLVEADVVSIHAPHTPESHHLIGAEQLARMKDGAILVNTSRGPLVDLDALRAVLEEGRLAGAGLDVLEHEPPEADDPLLQRPDVVVTPHAGFYSEESIAELQRKAAEQVVAALDGRMPAYAINPEALERRPG